MRMVHIHPQMSRDLRRATEIAFCTCLTLSLVGHTEVSQKVYRATCIPMVAMRWERSRSNETGQWPCNSWQESLFWLLNPCALFTFLQARGPLTLWCGLGGKFQYATWFLQFSSSAHSAYIWGVHTFLLPKKEVKWNSRLKHTRILVW